MRLSPVFNWPRWNSARCFANLLDDRWEDLCLGRRVLELGAGGGLPGLICALNGAETVSALTTLIPQYITPFCKQVVLTDYPDPDLLSNLAENVGLNLDAQIAPRVKVEVRLLFQRSSEARSDIGLGPYMGIVYCFISTERTVRPHHLE